MNYQKIMDSILEKEQNNRPTLLLHACCAPCSSYVLEYLNKICSYPVSYLSRSSIFFT